MQSVWKWYKSGNQAHRDKKNKHLEAHGAGLVTSVTTKLGKNVHIHRYESYGEVLE